jgi:prevent-host-death family protein
MRSVSALDVRKKFGQLLDEAAAGERLIIERAGQPVAALVPLSDVPELNGEERIRRRLQAIDDIARMARQRPGDRTLDAVTLIREQRRLRDEQIMRAVEQRKSKQE